jgi:hypothetical protein
MELRIYVKKEFMSKNTKFLQFFKCDCFNDAFENQKILFIFSFK